MTRSKRAALWAGWLFVAVIGVGVQQTLGWRSLLEPWQRLNVWQLVAATALIVLTYLLRSLRQSAYFPDRMAGRFWLSTRLMVWHNFYNHFLPMRAGELSFPVLAKRYFGIDYAQAAGALAWFRLLDLWAIGVFGLLAAAWARPLWLVPFAAVLPVPWLTVVFARPIERFLSRRKSALAIKLGRVAAALPRTGAMFWSSCLWTVSNWGVKLLAFAWLLTLFADMPYAAAVVGAIGGDLTSVLPVHGPAGLGTYEAGVVAALLPFGLKPERAIPAALSLHLMILASTLVGAVLVSLLPHSTKGIPPDDKPRT